jgi:tetratricopeptide (TPR) repeat protein
VVENPYFYGPPASKETGFYDRDDVFRFVNNTLSSPRQNVIILHGQRRIGKTSILRQIPRHLRHPEQYHTVFFDLQGERRDSSSAEMLYKLAQAISCSLEYPPPDRNRFARAPESFENEFLSRIYDQLGPRRLLLTIDEFDILAEIASEAQDVHPLVKHIDRITQSEPHQERVAFVFVIGRAVKDVRPLLRALRGATSMQVAFLPLDYARQLITDPPQPQMAFTDDAVRLILSLTGRHPYYIQLLCHHAFNRVANQNRAEITAVDVQEILEEALSSAQYAMSWFWDDVPAVERFILFATSQASSPEEGMPIEQILQARNASTIPISDAELKNTATVLVERQILVRDKGNRYRFAVELVRHWIEQHHTVEEIKQDPIFVNEQALSFVRVGQIAEGEENLEGAIENYRRARNAAPNYVEAYLHLGRALVKKGNLEEAIGEFLSADRLGRAEARTALIDARLQYGDRLEGQEKRDDAIREYERILEIDAEHAEARQRLGRLHLTCGHDLLLTEGPSQAEPDYDKALSYKPDCWPEVWSKLEGYRDDCEGQQAWRRAEQAMQIAVKLRQDDLDLHRALIETRLKQIPVWLSGHDIRSAQETGQRALDECPDSLHEELASEIKRLFNRYREKCEPENDWERSERAMRTLVHILPKDEEAIGWLATTLENQGEHFAPSEPDKAIEAYGKAREVRESLGEIVAPVLLRQGQVLLDVHRIEEAQSACWLALDESSFDVATETQVKSMFIEYRNWRESQQDWEHAEEAMKWLVQLLPDDPGPPRELAQTRLRQAQSYLGENDVLQAKAACDRAMMDSPNDQASRGQIQECFEQYLRDRETSGQLSLAQQAAHALYELLPDEGIGNQLTDFCIKYINFYLSDDNIDEAIRSCELVCDCFSNSPQTTEKIKGAFKKYGRRKERNGAWEQAEQAFRALVRFLPQDVEAWQLLARTCENQGDAHLKEQQFSQAQRAYRCAAEAWEQLREQTPQDDTIREHLARARVKQGQTHLPSGDVRDFDLAAAQDACAKALAELPDNLDVIEDVKDLFNNHRKAQERAQRWEEAEQIAQSLLELLPQSSSVREELATSRRKQGDAYLQDDHTEKAQQAYDRAIETWQQLLQIRPDDNAVQASLTETRLKKVEGFLNTDDLEEAQKTASTTLEGQTDDRTAHQIKLLYNGCRDRQEAGEDWERAEQAAQILAELLPDDPDVRRQLAAFYGRQGDAYLGQDRAPEAQQAFDNAIHVWQELLRMRPEDTSIQSSLQEAWLKKVEGCLARHDVQAAHQASQEAIAARAEDSQAPLHIRKLFTNYRREHESASEWERAEQAILVLADMFPADSHIQRHIAALYGRQGDAWKNDGHIGKAQDAYDKAIQGWQALLQEAPSDASIREMARQIWLKKAQGYLETHHLQAAQEASKKALAQQPGDTQMATIIENLFNAHQKQHEFDRQWPEAEDTAAALAELFPSNPDLKRQLADLRVKRGDAHDQAGEIEQAVHCYERALDGYEGSSLNGMSLGDIWMKSGRMYEQLGRPDEARKAYKKAEMLFKA